MYKLTRLDRLLAFSAITLSVIYYLYNTMYNGFLPAPFFYDKNDTFMDFHNLQYWAYNSGRYTEWKSVYTPFSFVLVMFFTSYLPGDELFLRDISTISIGVFFLIAICSIVYFQSKSIRSGNKSLWVYILLMSAPFLFMIERGNLLLYALAFLLISIMNYRKIFIFSLFFALAVSLKIYLIALLFIPILNLDFSKLVVSLFFIILINFISGIVLGDSNWLLFLQNINEFSSKPRYYYEWLYFTYSYQNGLFGVGYQYPQYEFITVLANWLMLFISFLLFGLVSIKYFLSAKYFKNRQRNTVTALLLMLIIVTIKNTGGYAFILLFPFVTEIIFNRISFYVFLLLLLPMEPSLMYLNSIVTESYVSGDQVSIDRNITFGMIIRPLLFLTLYIYISINFLLKKNINV